MGEPTPSDDLKGGEVKLFKLDELMDNRGTLVVPTHRLLVSMLVSWRERLTRVKQIEK
jgi:hypothetical protein